MGMSAAMSDDSDSLQFNLPNCTLDLECIKSIPQSYVAHGDLSAKTSHTLSKSMTEREDS